MNTPQQIQEISYGSLGGGNRALWLLMALSNVLRLLGAVVATRSTLWSCNLGACGAVHTCRIAALAAVAKLTARSETLTCTELRDSSASGQECWPTLPCSGTKNSPCASCSTCSTCLRSLRCQAVVCSVSRTPSKAASAGPKASSFG